LRADTSLSEDDLKAIKALPIDLKEVEADSPIVSEGDRPSHCCLMVTGFSIRSKVASTGRRQILSFHIPGDIPDLQSLFLGKMDHDLGTISPATLGFIKHTALDRLVTDSPTIARALWRETLIDAAIFREWIVNMGARPGPARMAHLMAELRERMASVGLTSDGEFPFPVTQAELADALGMSSVHVNRILQTYRAQRILDLQRNNIHIANYEKIVSAGGFDPAYLHLHEK
jgi:CRP-like cAMP-binding protein